VGRPSIFTEELGQQICAEIMLGKSLRTICEEEAMPCMSSVCNWLARDKEFMEHYAHAREVQAALMADELLDIADDGRNDWMTVKRGKEEIEVVNREAVMRSQLRVDTRKWIASKLLPKKYGDKLALEHGISDGLAEKLAEAQRRISE
jgi:hypothetical protein